MPNKKEKKANHSNRRVDTNEIRCKSPQPVASLKSPHGT